MKRVTLGLAMVFMAAGVSLAGLNDGLVAYYAFAHNTKDSSGNNNDGKVYGNVSYVRGVIGMAAKFGGYDDKGYIHVPNSSSLKFSENATFSLWLKVNDSYGQTIRDCSGKKENNTSQVILAKYNDRKGICIPTSIGSKDFTTIKIDVNAWDENKSGAQYVSETPMGKWIHIAIVTGSKGTKIYSNGELVNTSNDLRPTDFRVANSEDMYIGVQPGKDTCLDWWCPLNGELDEVRIYNRALSDDEVSRLVNSGK